MQETNTLFWESTRKIILGFLLIQFHDKRMLNFKLNIKVDIWVWIHMTELTLARSYMHRDINSNKPFGWSVIHKLPVFAKRLQYK